MGFVANIVSGAVNAVSSVVSGVTSAVSTVTQALGPIGTVAAAYFGMPYLAPTGFAALSAPSILGGGMTGAGMLTSGTLGTALGSGIGGSLLSTAGGLGVSSAFSGANSFINGLGGFTSSVPNASSSFGSIANSLSNFAQKGSSSFMPGESGGMPNSGGGTFDKLSKLIRGGMDIYNATQYGPGQTPTAAQSSADPYAPYRAQAATKLNELMADPSLVYGLPGYNFAQEEGTKQIGRAAAATGQSISGNTLAAINKQSQGTAKTWFDDYVNNLSMQSGANQNPAGGQAAYSTAANFQSLAEKSKKDAQMQGVLGLGSALTSFFA